LYIIQKSFYQYSSVISSVLDVLERVLECAAGVLRGKKSKIEEDFFGFACYASPKALLDFSQTR